MDLQAFDDFWDELNLRAKTDPQYQECAEEVIKRTAAYTAIFQTLTPKQQEELDLYIAACEEAEHSAAFVAYRIGREHQMLGKPNPLPDKI